VRNPLLISYLGRRRPPRAFRIGEMVRVVEGPLAPFHGAIEKIKVSTIDGIDSPTRLRLLSTSSVG